MTGVEIAVIVCVAFLLGLIVGAWCVTSTQARDERLREYARKRLR